MRKLFLLVALIAIASVAASAQQRRYTPIVSEPEPLPNCAPGAAGVEMPFLWDITAAAFKFCSGTNAWSTLSGGGGGGGPIVQTNGVTNTNQTTLNFQNAGLFNWTNPSAGNEQVNFGSQSANCFVAAPNGIGGIPTCRLIVAADIPAGTTCATHFYATGLLAGLVPVCIQPSFTDLLGTIALGQTALTTNGDLLSVSGGVLARVASAGGTDFVLQGANAAVPVWLAVNNCGSGTQALSYSTTTHTFGCQTITVGTGTINNSTQYSGVYYSVAGNTNTLSGVAAPTTPSVPFLWCSTPSGGLATAPTWCQPGVPINGQTTTSYTVVSTDRENLDTMSNTSPVAVSLPQAGSAGFTNNFNFALANVNTGLTTITPTTSTINGNATQIVPNHWVSYIYSDNTNYRAATVPDIAAFINCTDTAGNHLNFTSSTGLFSCGTTTGNPTFDKSATGLLNPTADATFTQPSTSVTGWTLAGTAPASAAGVGTAASTLFNVSAIIGGATTGNGTTAGTGSSPSIVSGAGGSGAGGTNAIGGAGGSITLTAGNGGASGGNAVNSNGGNIALTVGSAGTGGSGTAGKAGVVSVSGPTAGLVYYTQGSAPTTANTNIPANTLFEYAPTIVTPYGIAKPGVSAQGVVTGTLSGTVITQSISGDTNHSATVTIGSGTSIGSTSLCPSANCPAGTYRVNVYLDITAACGTSGTYIVNLIYTDDQGSKTIPVNINGTGAVPATGVLTTTSTSNFGENAQVIRSTGAASINYSTTATACGTGGPMVGKLYLSVEAVQ